MTHIVSVHVTPPGSPEADLLIVGCFEGEAPEAGEAEEGIRTAVERLAGRPGWRGKEEQVAQTEAGGKVVALHGLGSRKDFSFNKLARWLWTVGDQTRLTGVRNLGVLLPAHPETTGPDAAERITRCLALAGYRFDRFQSPSKERERPERIAVVPPAGEEEAYRAALAVSGAVAEAVVFARELGNTPPNEAHPAWMAERARELGESRGMEVTVLEGEELRSRGMGGLLAVGGGSDTPPRMVRLAWGDSGPRVALVGKGITFDSGGVSIKPASDMDEMKYDKCGACAVLGAARAIVDLKLPVRLSVYVAFAENLLDGRSYRPGDILRCYNGKTVEITNTDAEGRIILADALSWAVEDGAEALVEMSTLTGSCVIALGHQAAGLFTPDDQFAADLLAASESSGERLWRLPLFPEFLEDMKGAHADLKNSAGRWGGASNAAAFLSQFVGDLKAWAHRDIAGMAYLGNDQDGKKRGATGFGVATAVSWLRRMTG